MEAYLPHYMQLLGLGVFWMSIHCAGMCGPIMVGLASSGPVSPEASARSRAWSGARRVLAYQGGRALTYALLGGVAGWLGHAVEGAITGFASVAGMVIAVVLVLAGLGQIPWVKARLPWGRASGGGAGRFVGGVLRRVNKHWPEAIPGRMAAIGVVMGLLPCLLMFWVLGLAAATASPLHGALMMLLLVAMTTPVLLVAGCGPLLASPSLRRWGQSFLPGAVSLSGVWMGLIAAAANGWIEHQHLTFSFWGEGYHMMFW